MHNRIITITLLTILCSALNSPASNVAEFNVATYNIRQINEEDSINGDGWERRCPIIANLIGFHEFHIFGTQEGFKSQLEDLKALLPGYDYTGVAREDGADTGEHSAIFYDTEMFELIDHGDFWLSETPDTPSLGWDAACVRICSWGKFRHRGTDKVFQFFNLHLDHVGDTARIESVLLVQRNMKKIGLDLPTFLTGDFNVDQTDQTYKVLSASDFLTDSYKKANLVYALNGTLNLYHTDRYTESRIDHIFVTDDIDVKKYGILTDSYRTPWPDEETTADGEKKPKRKEHQIRVPSDHFPVMIKVKLQ